MLVIQKFYGIYLRKKSFYYKARELKQQKWLITPLLRQLRKLQAIVWLLFLLKNKLTLQVRESGQIMF